jgi:3-oxoacyl-[acyl-carrier protein] reductase
VQRLDGQVAVITGAGSATGIGFACARALADDGAHVVLAATTDRARERAADIVAGGGAATSVIGDLTRASDVEALARAAHDVAGRIDIVVNNAGMIAVGGSHTDSRAVDLTDTQWDDAIRRNLTTCFAVTRACLPAMIRDRYGRIVNIASTSGPVQAFVGDAGYHAAKAGMVGLTRAVALEVATQGITVNAVAPGWIATGSQTDQEQRAGELTPMRRSGTSTEVGALVRWLADPSASYITGQLITVDGGNSLAEDRSWRAG